MPPSATELLADAERTILADNGEELAASLAKAERLLANMPRVPASVDPQTSMRALALLARLSEAKDVVDEVQSELVREIDALRERLVARTKPTSAAITAAIETLKERIGESALAEIDAHNDNRPAGVDRLPALTRHSPCGAKLTITDGYTPSVTDAALVPDKFKSPDTKAITAAFKNGETVPGVASIRKPGFRLSAKAD